MNGKKKNYVFTKCLIATVGHFHWLKETHKLKAESVHYELIKFYNTGPGITLSSASS
jgi:hypothetical protein